MPRVSRRPRKTVEDYLALPDDVRAELIDGELYVTPAPWVPHQRMVGALYRLLFEHATRTGSGEVLLSPVDVHLPTGDVVQPDVVYVSRAQRDIIDRRVDGVPDLAVEVISPSHPERDRFVKRARYALAGIQELWLVDPEERSLQVLVLDGDEFRSIGYSDGDAPLPSPTFPDLELCPTALFRELDP